MKFALKLLFSIFALLVAAYHLAFFVMPAITVKNDFSQGITHATVALPSSNLDFGHIVSGEENTLHYSLEQGDGVYKFQLQLVDGTELKGICGYVTNNEVNKRVLIRLTKDKKVLCE